MTQCERPFVNVNHRSRVFVNDINGVYIVNEIRDLDTRACARTRTRPHTRRVRNSQNHSHHSLIHLYLYLYEIIGVFRVHLCEWSVNGLKSIYTADIVDTFGDGVIGCNPASPCSISSCGGVVCVAERFGAFTLEPLVAMVTARRETAGPLLFPKGA